MAENRDYGHIRPTRSFDDLVKVMEILRRECPWDKKQTHESLKDLMVEEVYEAIEAIDRRDYDELKKELGDIMLHVVFHAEMGRQSGNFNIGDVIFGIQEKLIRRHPHIFSDVHVDGVGTVLKNWEKIKQKENGDKSVLDGVPKNLPGLLKAQRMQEKAGGVGFDWKKWQDAWKKLLEELVEFQEKAETGQVDDQADEFGDVLFSMVNVGRLMGLNAEDSLRLTNQKFLHRFNHIEKRLKEKGKKITEASLEEMDQYWEEAKKNGS